MKEIKGIVFIYAPLVIWGLFELYKLILPLNEDQKKAVIKIGLIIISAVYFSFCFVRSFHSYYHTYDTKDYYKNYFLYLKSENSNWFDYINILMLIIVFFTFIQNLIIRFHELANEYLTIKFKD